MWSIAIASALPRTIMGSSASTSDAAPSSHTKDDTQSIIGSFTTVGQQENTIEATQPPLASPGTYFKRSRANKKVKQPEWANTAEAAECDELKRVYEKCFLTWLAGEFLPNGSALLPCQKEWDDYQKSLTARLEKCSKSPAKLLTEYWQTHDKFEDE